MDWKGSVAVVTGIGVAATADLGTGRPYFKQPTLRCTEQSAPEATVSRSRTPRSG